jgi:hypothetical protein
VPLSAISWWQRGSKFDLELNSSTRLWCFHGNGLNNSKILFDHKIYLVYPTIILDK